MPVDLSNEINDEDESAFDTQSGRRSPQQKYFLVNICNVRLAVNELFIL
jgi:hypothetical protein